MLQNLERALEFRSELAPAFDIEGSHRPVEKAKPNPFAKSEAKLPVLAIILLLVLLLRLFQAFPYMEQEFITFLQLMVHCR
jgi:hypothetical protein